MTDSVLAFLKYYFIPYESLMSFLSNVFTWGHVVKERKWTNARHVSCTAHSQKEEPQEKEEDEIFHLSSLYPANLEQHIYFRLAESFR